MPIGIEFVEIELSRYYSLTAKGGPEFLTSILGSPFGAQQRNVTRADAIHKFTIQFNGEREEENFPELLAFFMARRGAAIGFRFYSFYDNSWTDELIALTAKDQASYKLIRTYTAGGRPYVRRIVKPIAPVAVTINGVPAQNFSPFSIDYSKGVITFATPSALPVAGELRVTGHYCIPVTFSVDKVDISGDMGYFDLEGLAVVEILPPALGINDFDESVYTPDTFLPTTPGNVNGAPYASDPSHALTITWSAASALNGKTIVGYKVRVNGGLIPDVIGATTVDIGSLAPNTFYSIQVAAFDSNGIIGLYSATKLLKTAAAAGALPPGIPTGVTASMIGANAVRVAWTASSAPTSGGSVGGYKVSLGNGLIYDVGNVTTIDIGSLPLDVAFQVQVQSYDTNSPRNYSDYSTPAINLSSNNAPVATNVAVTGNPVAGATLTGSFTYADAESDAAGTPVFKWYRASNATGANLTKITGASAQTYVLQSADIGKFIKFTVTPIALTGTISGVETGSAFTSAIAASSQNAAPVAINVTVTGNRVVGQVLTGHYDFSDAEGNAEDVSTFKWYRADNASGLNASAISGATSLTYTLQSADGGKYLRFGVVPIAEEGTLQGAEAFSSYGSAIAAAPNGNTITDISFGGGAGDDYTNISFGGGAGDNFTDISSGGGA